MTDSNQFAFSNLVKIKNTRDKINADGIEFLKTSTLTNLFLNGKLYLYA